MILKKNKTISHLLLCMTLSLFSCSKLDQYGMEQKGKDLGIKRESETLNEMPRKKAKRDHLPVGDSDIKNVLLSGYYADKTALVGKLLMEGKPSFIVRPRRFGKTLFINTIAAVAAGEVNKELFKNCFIYNGEFEDENGNSVQYNWEKKYPVINLDFSGLGNGTAIELKRDIKNSLYDIANKYNVASKIPVPQGDDSIQSYYKALVASLIELGSGYEPKIVLLMDEYDRPVINLDWSSNQYKDCLQVLKDFFTVVKSCANDCHLMFMTGVYKFVLADLGSGANIFHSHDLSINHEAYSDIVGYKEEHIKSLFTSRLPYVKKQLNKKLGKTYTDEEVFQVVREYYNGYKFYPFGPSLYNPTSVLSFFETGLLKGYWQNTGDTSILMDQMKKNIEKFSVDKINESFLQSEDDLLETAKLEELDVIPLMYQSGYLTIKDYDISAQQCVLDFPNKEVKEALSKNFNKHFARKQEEYGKQNSVDVQKSFREENWGKLFSIIRSNCFANASYELTEKTERSFHVLLYGFLNGAFLSDSNVKVSAELQSNIGQADITIKDDSSNTVCIIELKLNKDSYTGLKQIVNKDYYGQYLNDYKKIVCVGMNIVFNDDNKVASNPHHRNVSDCSTLVSCLDANNNWSNGPVTKFFYHTADKIFSDSVLSQDETDALYKIINTKRSKNNRRQG